MSEQEQKPTRRESIDTVVVISNCGSDNGAPLLKSQVTDRLIHQIKLSTRLETTKRGGMDVKSSISFPKAHLEPVTNGTLSSSSSTADLSQPGNQLVPCPPSFKIKLKEDTEILAGCTVHFELLVKGYPVPTLSFYKNQHPLQVNNNNGRIKVIYHRPDFCEFRIEKVRPEDSAVYEVLAINDLGSATTTGVLRVTMNHKVLFSGLQGGRSRSSSRSSTPSLNLYRPGQPPLYIWFKDGVQFDVTDNRFQCHFNESDNTISLIFNQVNASDVGVYTCVAHTSRGKISCSAELKSEKSKAIFKRHLSDFEASDGDEDIDLIVKLDGSPKPLIRWLFEGKEIRESDGYKFITRRGSIMDKANQPSSDQTSSNTHILRINRASAEMNGVYTCEAFNSEGKSESSGRLTVNSKPKFLDHLRDTEVAIGTDITLSVKIVGYPFPDVTWYRNGHPIIPPSPGGTDDRVYIAKANPFHDNLHMLKIRNFGEDDEGEYSVEAVNLYGRVASSARIMVSERPVFKKILPPELNVQIGEEHVDLIVEFEPHPPISFVKWFVDDIEIIPLDRRYQILSDARKKVFKLRILRVNEGTAGSYMVIASNDSGSNYSSCEVKVVSPPEFMQGLEDRLARPGDAVTMDVVVSGNPAPRVRWYKDRRELTSGTEGVRIEMESDFVHILTIEKTNEATAEYECVITNEFGESRTKGTLTVIPEDEGKELEVGRFRIDVEEEHLPPLPQGLEEMEEDLEGDEEYEYVYESDEEGELEPIERRKMVVYVDATNPQKSTPFEQPNVQEQQIVREKPPLPTTPPRKKQHIGEMPTSTPESANLVNGGESRRDKELIVANREEEKKDDINSQQGNNLGTTHSSSPATKRDDESRTSAKAPESPPDPTPRRKRKSILEGGGRDSVISDFSSSGTFGQEETVGQEMTMTGKDEGEALILDTEPASIFEGIEVIRGPRDAFVEFRAVVCGSPMPQVKWYFNNYEIDPVCSKYIIQNRDDGCVALILRRVRPSDIGVYTLSVCNNLGSDTSSVEFSSTQSSKIMSFLSHLPVVRSVSETVRGYLSPSAETKKEAESNETEPEIDTKDRNNNQEHQQKTSKLEKEIKSNPEIGEVRRVSSSTSTIVKSLFDPIEICSPFPKGTRVNPLSLIVGGVVVLTSFYLLMRSFFPSHLSECERMSQAVASNVHEWMFRCTSSADCSRKC